MSMQPLRAFVLREERHVENLVTWIQANWRHYLGKHPLSVLIQPEGAKRTAAQNRYYWSVLNQISEQAVSGGKRYTPDVWHEFFKREFLGLVDLPEGRGTVGASTTDLTVAEFQDYIRKVEAFAAQHYHVMFLEAA